MISVYFTRITGTPRPADFQARLDELPADIKGKILSYNTLPEQLSRLCGKLILSKLLTDQNLAGNLSLFDIKYNEFAKPYFDKGPGFNIAHSGGVVICIASPGFKVGVDIEVVKETDIHGLKDQFTQNEWAQISANANKTDAFFRIWVRKEALTKAIGKGVFQQMDEIDVCSDIVRVGDDAMFLKDIFIAGGYAACIVTDEPDSMVAVREINMDELLLSQ